jgi:hypothetical protein
VKKGTKPTKRPAAKKRAAPAPPSARLPLPARGEKRHGDATKYERSREKLRLREEWER